MQFDAEYNKLKDLLRETLPFIRDAGNDEDPEAQAHARDLIARIHRATDWKGPRDG